MPHPPLCTGSAVTMGLGSGVSTTHASIDFHFLLFSDFVLDVRGDEVFVCLKLLLWTLEGSSCIAELLTRVGAPGQLFLPALCSWCSGCLRNLSQFCQSQRCFPPPSGFTEMGGVLPRVLLGRLPTRAAQALLRFSVGSPCGPGCCDTAGNLASASILE